MNANEKTYLFVGKSPSQGTATFADEGAFDPASLASGEYVFVDINTNTVEKVLTTAGSYKLFWKTSKGTVLSSPVIKTTNVGSITSTKYSAATQQVDYIGYNTSSGSIPYSDNDTFSVTVDIIDGTKSRFINKNQITATYATAASATQKEVATALSADLAKNALTEDVKIELVHSNAGAAVGTGIGTVTYTKGSNVITFGTDVDDTTGGATALAAGIGFRIGTTTADPIYIITAIDIVANTITVHAPVQVSGSSSTTTNFEQISSADLTAGSFGIKLTGKDDSEWKNNAIWYQMTKFNTRCYGTGFEVATNPLTKATKAVAPKGDYREVADLMDYARHAFTGGHISVHDYPMSNDLLQEVETGERYDQIVINTYNNERTNNMTGNAQNNYTVIIATPSYDQKITIPGTVDNTGTYTVTINGGNISFVTDGSATTAELYAGLLAAIKAAGIPAFGDGTSIIYVETSDGTTIAQPTAGTTTNDLTIAANTAVVYPSWTTIFTAS